MSENATTKSTLPRCVACGFRPFKSSPIKSTWRDGHFAWIHESCESLQQELSNSR